MRLIDKDELIAFIKANGYVYANTLESFPEVEAVPVVRGEWNNTYNSGYRPNPENVCSVCDCWNVRRSDYCPNCGADMRESEVKE